MGKRKSLSRSLRARILLRNQHACCICGKSGVQIHHINSDPGDNDPDNLAVLCLEHHDEATAPGGLTARLRPEEIRQYKENWENACRDRREKGARARTAFFMVDYKNAERLRQLFAQLSPTECEIVHEIMTMQLREETALREEQGYDISIEPNLEWSTPVEQLLEYVRRGEAHPDIFEGASGHPRDPLLPSGPAFSDKRVPLYDIWCQLMARALVIAGSPFILEDLLQLDDPISSGLGGSLIAFEGHLEGEVAYPDEWETNPVSETELRVSNDDTEWFSTLRLKTHYVYSLTASSCLASGRGCGLLLLRSIDDVSDDRKRLVSFTSTPLIVGGGGGKLLEIE